MFPRIDRTATAVGILLCLLIAHACGPAFADDNRARPAADALHVLIITGQGDHDWRGTVPFLRRILTDTGRFDVRVCEAPTGLTARTLAGFDVLVDDCGASTSDGETGKAVAGFVESGKGLVITRGALSSCMNAHAAHANSQAVQSDSSGTIPAYWPAVPSSGSPSRVHFLEVTIAQPGHPIGQGVQSEFKIADAVYRGMSVRPGAEVIATVLADAESGPNKTEPVLITSGHGKGRVLCTALGHDLAAMQETVFITTFARGTE